MAFSPGLYEVEIVSHEFQVKGDKETFVLHTRTVDTGEDMEVLIWFSEKAMGIARAALKICGFDCDARELTELDQDTTLLAGQRFTASVEDYRGRNSIGVLLRSKPTTGRLAAMSDALRQAKKSENGSAGAPYVPAATQPVPGATFPKDDDIPF